jgi:hypothetical protein
MISVYLLAIDPNIGFNLIQYGHEAITSETLTNRSLFVNESGSCSKPAIVERCY